LLLSIGYCSLTTQAIVDIRFQSMILPIYILANRMQDSYALKPGNPGEKTC
jgi:hypothetical protein